MLFSSVLTSGYVKDLEALLFFNSHQADVKDRIARAVERYGQPRVVREGGLLRVAVEKAPYVQALYALDKAHPGRELIGVIVYVRENRDRIAILHVAVREDYASSGGHAGAMLALRLITKVREIASRIRGVREVTMMYQPSRVRLLPVQHPSEADTRPAATGVQGVHVH